MVLDAPGAQKCVVRMTKNTYRHYKFLKHIPTVHFDTILARISSNRFLLLNLPKTWKITKNQQFYLATIMPKDAHRMLVDARKMQKHVLREKISIQIFYHVPICREMAR